MNKSSTKKQINLTSDISMVRNHGKPNTTWNTFDDINGPVYNDTLAPLYYDKSESVTLPIIDNNGDVYRFENGSLYRNNTVIHNTSNKGFKREILSIDSTSAIVSSDNKICYTKFENGVLTIFKEDTALTTQSFGGVDITAERLWINGSDIRYFCIHNDNTYSCYYGGKWNIAKPINWYKKDVRVTDVDISSPLISVYGNYVFVTNKSGSRIDYATLCWFMLSLDSTITQITSLTIGKTYKPVTRNETISFSNVKIVSTSKQQQLTCTKVGDKYLDADGNEITFSAGYIPTIVSGNTYRYQVYTTTYIYTLIASAATYIKNIKINFNLSDVKYPEDIETKVFTKTLTKSGTATYSTSLEYTSNNGYMEGNSFVNIEAVLTWTDDTTATIPNTWFDITTFFLNRSSSATKTLTFVRHVDEEVGDGSFSQSVMLDDGIFYSLGYKSTEKTNDSNILNLANEFSSKSGSTITLKGIVKYSVSSTSDFTHYWRATTVNLGQNYFRSFMYLKTDTEKTWHQLGLVNDVPIFYPGRIDYADIKYEDIDLPLADNNRGYRTRNAGFRALFNAGFISGISYSANENQGTLLCPWNAVSTESYYQITNDFVLFKNSTINKWVIIKVVNNVSEMKLIEDRYLVLNTIDFNNCYDIKLNKFIHYASDWNNRFVIGGGYYVDTKTRSIATGENVIYQQSESGITSALWPAETLLQCGTDDKNLKIEGQGIDVFLSEGISLPKYYTTFYGNRRVTNPLLDIGGVRVNYPSISSTYIMINPNLFSKFIQTGNNKDYIVDDGWAYSLIYDNAVTPILLASTSSYVDNMEAMFVVQSMPYGVMNNKLYSLNYLNGVYQGADAIMNIKGMKYIGNIPTKAYFYSPMNRGIYAFTGDANLALLKEASAIGEIYNTWYNSATQTVYMATDNGLYMLGSSNTYRQEFYDVAAVYFNDDGTSYIVNKEGDKYVIYHLSLEYKEGYITNKVRLDTGLYGVDGNENIVIDRWNITLWNDRKENGNIKVYSFTLTDKGTIEKEEIVKEIKAADWDKEWNNVQISWVPKYNRGIGVGAFIETDFAISDIVASVSKDVNTMPSKVNI